MVQNRHLGAFHGKKAMFRNKMLQFLAVLRQYFNILLMSQAFNAYRMVYKPQWMLVNHHGYIWGLCMAIHGQKVTKIAFLPSKNGFFHFISKRKKMTLQIFDMFLPMMRGCWEHVQTIGSRGGNVTFGGTQNSEGYYNSINEKKIQKFLTTLPLI